MRLAVLSDIHSNLEALESVLSDIDRRSVDDIICLGDIVGYGADPNACLELIRSRARFSVLGNHDQAVNVVEERIHFNPSAERAVEWTASLLDENAREYLASLPYRVSFENLLFVHSAPKDPTAWEYVFSGFEARLFGRYFAERICFIGHSHVPGMYALDASVRGYDPTQRYLINVGSVGQPRDGDWRCSYGLLDTVAGSYENIRLEYDVETAMKKIVASRLPKNLAGRLKAGL